MDAEMKSFMLEVLERLARLEKQHKVSAEKEWYTPEEVAERLGKSAFTVRQWCNHEQARAKKIRGRGGHGEWRISHEELVRLQNEGPIPLKQLCVSRAA